MSGPHPETVMWPVTQRKVVKFGEDPGGKIKELYSAMPAYCPAQMNHLFLCFALLSETNLYWTIPISMSSFMLLLHFGRCIHRLLLCWVNYYWSFKFLFKSQASCKAFLDIFILCWLLLKLNPLELLQYSWMLVSYQPFLSLAISSSAKEDIFMLYNVSVRWL